MPIVEYKFNVSEEGKNIIPGYIVDRGYHYRDSDKTYLGFVLAEADREYWIPDPLAEKSKSDCVTRALAMHSASPFMRDSDGTEVTMSNSEVTSDIENWYDQIIANNS